MSAAEFHKVLHNKGTKNEAEEMKIQEGRLSIALENRFPVAVYGVHVIWRVYEMRRRRKGKVDVWQQYLLHLLYLLVTLLKDIQVIHTTPGGYAGWKNI